MSKKLSNIYINSVKDLLQRLDIIYGRKINNDPLSSPILNQFLFRGISNEKYTLLPGIYRKIKIDDGEEPMYFCYGNDTEKVIINEFKQHALQFLNKKDASLIDVIEFAQHHFAPTRLLDLTSNPLVALYFSCIENDKTDGAIWVIDSDLYYLISMPDRIPYGATIRDVLNIYLDNNNKSINKDMPIIYTTNYLDSRMSAQSSYFLMWGDNHKTLEEILLKNQKIKDNSNKQNNRTLNSYYDFLNRPLMYKLIVKNQKKKRIIRELDMLGINELALFPGLDGVGNYIRKKYLLNETEAKEMVVNMNRIKRKTNN